MAANWCDLTCGVSRAARTLTRHAPHAARHTPLRALLQPNLPIHRAQIQDPPAATDRAAQSPWPKPARDRQRVIGLDLAIHGTRAYFGVELIGHDQRDSAVHRGELELVRP